MTRIERKVSLASQIAEVDREIAMRRQVYGRRVNDRKMRQSEAELLIERMQAVRNTLAWLKDNEADVRAFVEARRKGRPS